MSTQPYVTKLPDGRYLAVELPEGSAQLDPLTGEVVLHPPAIHLLDRLRVLLSPLPSSATAARLRTLRQALGMGRDELADKLGVEVRQVTAWESGRARPTAKQLASLDRLRKRAARSGVLMSSDNGRRPTTRLGDRAPSRR